MPPSPASRADTFGVSIFAEMTRLALEHQAVNLSQGFPDFDGPDTVRQAALDAIQAGHNQYAITSGLPGLRRAIAAHARRFYGQVCDPDTEVTVTSGATEGVFAAIMGMVNPGDEVIVFEPYFDVYVPDILMAGGVPRFVPLRPPDWNFDPAELAAAFNARTRLIIVNTPHNPTGKIYTREELLLIADLCQKWDVAVVSDEVYEHIVFDGARHLRPAQLPGLADRTLTVSSQGKTFSFTGWKIGWVIAPPALTRGVRAVHQFVIFASGTPFQIATAAALDLDDEYYHALAAAYQAKRDFLVAALRSAGLRVNPPQGTYFITADFTPLGFDDDVNFCRWLTREIGVAAIPTTAFYCDEHKPIGRAWARFAFCKRPETLEKAAERLAQVKARLSMGSRN